MNRANVQSIDAIKAFRLTLLKFGEVAARILNDADGEIQRVLIWLETEQNSYWRGQVIKRSELATRAKNAVLSKKLYKNVDGTPGSAIEEEKALKLALQRVEEAQEKTVNVRKYTQRLQKETLIYRGLVQRLANLLQTDIPAAADHLDSLAASLEAYVGLAGAKEAPATVSGPAEWPEAAATEPAVSMARPEPPAAPPGATAAAAPAPETSEETRNGRP